MKYKSLLVLALIMVVSVTNAQDVIVTMDGQKIDAKILEVSKSDIKYKEKDYLDGPTFVLETAEISSIIYGNGKVVSYVSKQEAAQEPEKVVEEPIKAEKADFLLDLDSTTRQTLLEYLDGRPKKLVALSGGYSKLYSKNRKVYFDLDFDDAERVVYDLGDDDPISKGKLQTYLKEENVELNKYFIAKSACEIFNQKLLLDKCRLFPITRFDPKNVDQNTHKMLLHITRIDVGSDAIGRMANGQSYAGGAVISGYIEIIDAYTDTLCCIIVVDRVSGLGSKFPNVRIRYAVEELISNQLFHIKKFDD